MTAPGADQGHCSPRQSSGSSCACVRLGSTGDSGVRAEGSRLPSSELNLKRSKCIFLLSHRSTPSGLGGNDSEPRVEGRPQAHPAASHGTAQRRSYPSARPVGPITAPSHPGQGSQVLLFLLLAQRGGQTCPSAEEPRVSAAKHRLFRSGRLLSRWVS